MLRPKILRMVGNAWKVIIISVRAARHSEFSAPIKRISESLLRIFILFVAGTMAVAVRDRKIFPNVGRLPNETPLNTDGRFMHSAGGYIFEADI